MIGLTQNPYIQREIYKGKNMFSQAGASSLKTDQ